MIAEPCHYIFKKIIHAQPPKNNPDFFHNIGRSGRTFIVYKNIFRQIYFRQIIRQTPRHMIFFISLVDRVGGVHFTRTKRINHFRINAELNQLRAKLVQGFGTAGTIVCRTNNINRRVGINFHCDLQKNWSTNPRELADHENFFYK